MRRKCSTISAKTEIISQVFLRALKKQAKSEKIMAAVRLVSPLLRYLCMQIVYIYIYTKQYD